MIREPYGTITAVYLALFIFGIGYNAVTAWVEQRGYIHGFTALMVVGGVLITLGGVAVIEPVGALIALGAFVASGMPMAVGSIWRYVRDRERLLQAMRDEARNDGA